MGRNRNRLGEGFIGIFRDSYYEKHGMEGSDDE